MWIEIPHSYIFERMTSFTIPEKGRMIICSYDGAHFVTLAPTVSVVHDLTMAEEYTGGEEVEWEGTTHRTLGYGGGNPILVHPDGSRLILRITEERVDLIAPNGEIVQTLEFSDLSGDWGFATFSSDGEYLVIGVPYDIYLYRQET